MRDELLEPLRRSLGWLASLRDGEGRIVCPEHGLEHTGKSACAAITSAALALHDGAGDRPARRALAVQQGERLVANLVREGTSPCHTFWPGRHDPFNSSNAIIDGGACSDALAELVRTFGPELEPDLREAFTRASLLHAHTYLRHAVLDKGIPAQRAWGLTGLSAAAALARELADPEADDLERASLEAVGALEAIQNGDGSFPYHPREWGGEHEGASDVSSYYQSRVTGFTLFALERLGRAPTDPLFAGPLQSGLRFLQGLQGPDGLKVGLVEAKPWYWGAPYEVASHPFDVFTLAGGWKHFGRAAHGLGARRAFEAWSEHLTRDGVPRSHLDGPGRGRSYQCPVFWASHACWIARALPRLDELWDRTAPEPADPDGPRGIDLALTWFPDASLVRLEDGVVVAWVRGRRPGYNVHHGSPHGAGLVRALRKSDGSELVPRRRLVADQAGEWSGACGRPALGRGWRSGGRELRFSVWLARNHWRGHRPGAALRAPLVTLRRGVLDFAKTDVSSSFVLAPGLEPLPDGVALDSGLAWRGGEAVPGARLERSFQVDGEGLVVTERLRAAGGVRGLAYRVPEGATEVSDRREPGGAEREIRFRLA